MLQQVVVLMFGVGKTGGDPEWVPEGLPRTLQPGEKGLRRA